MNTMNQLIKEIEGVVDLFENSYEEGKNAQQAVRAMYQIKELIIKYRINLKTINESKM